MRRLLVVLAGSMLLLGTIACSEDTQDDAREAAEDAGRVAEEGAEDAAEAGREAADRAEDVIDDRQVQIDNFAYEPETRTVKVGTEVTWVNQDEAPHTVTSDEEGFESDELDEGDEFSNRFTDEGTYEYHCEIHGADRMSGTVVVES